MLIFPNVSGPDFVMLDFHLIYQLLSYSKAAWPRKTSLCSPHPQILTQMPQGIRIAWYHNKGILSWSPGQRDPGVFHILPYYLFMIWGGGAVAFSFKRPLRENQSTILRGTFFLVCMYISAGYVWGSFLINQVIHKQTLLRNNFQHHLPRDSVLFQQVQNWAPL